jgi:hypothetical protein
MSRIVTLSIVAFCVSVTAAQAQLAESGYAQLNIGTIASKGAGVLIAAEGGMAVAENIEAFADLGWSSKLQPATLDPSARTISDFLQRTTGQPAAYSSDAPAFFGDLGARYFFKPRYGVRPYGLGSIGFARIDQQVQFTLSGNDVTSNIGDYGVTLGEDLDGAVTKASLGLGVGVLVPFHTLQFDVGYNYNRIFTRVGTNAHRIYGGVRYRF